MKLRVLIRGLRQAGDPGSSRSLKMSSQVSLKMQERGGSISWRVVERHVPMIRAGSEGSHAAGVKAEGGATGQAAEGFQQLERAGIGSAHPHPRPGASREEGSLPVP